MMHKNKTPHTNDLNSFVEIEEYMKLLKSQKRKNVILSNVKMCLIFINLAVWSYVVWGLMTK